VGAVAVLVLTVEYGRPPWVGLVLAVSFGTYGLLKKQAGAGAVEGLVFETAILSPMAAGYLVWLTFTTTSTFAAHGWGHVLLLASTGVVTALPLLCFGGAAVRLPIVTLGLLQYLAPALQFLIGLLVFDETMSPARWVGFALVWVALALFTGEAISHYRRRGPQAQGAQLETRPLAQARRAAAGSTRPNTCPAK
jgi:chloramphenicol-sensitive protein RarD